MRLLFLSLLLVSTSLINGRASDASTPTSASSGSGDASTPTSGSSGSGDASTPTSGSSGSGDASTPTSGSSGSGDASTPTSGSSGSGDASTPTSGSSGSGDASTPTSGSSGSGDASTPTSGSSGSGDASTPTSGSSGSGDASTPTSGSSGSGDASTPTSGSSGSGDASTPTSGSSGSGDASTQPPATSPQTNSSVTTPGSSNPCEPNPCGRYASCVRLYSGHFCLCSQGYYYQNLSCVKGKTFPGEISTTVPDSSDLENENSKAYQDLYNDLVKFFKKALDKTGFGFGQTVILKVSASSSLSARSAIRAAEKLVYASVINMFDENTAQNESTITAAIEEQIKKDGNVMVKYAKQDVCDLYNCVKNGKDDCQNGLQCQCKPGMIRPNKVTPYCVSSGECAGPCSAQERKQCIKKDNEEPKCVCMPGYQNSTSGKCEECPFGYSGVDCNDKFQLILTIVGTIAGALVLILLIALIVSVSSKKKKKNVEEQKLIEDDSRNIRMQQAGFSNSGFSNSGFSNTGFSNFGGDNSIFPKVRTGVPSQTQNPYVNQRSMSRPDY
ncbi:mucin-13 [Mesocricetus auratus]|uniref:Mucin-13 n=1 Tax=Mesocricetus auratus TaxID=10036 RepID=A0ABM2XVW2_MESAU|nr:mucin-13 [Mesocricetus auratus]XP_040606823.1 mucin-13 [Mesocricetus auratus]